MSLTNRSVSVVSLLVLLVVSVIPLAALAAGPGGTFGDDDGNVHEANIEVIVVPEITVGCAFEDPASFFCPNDPVTRAQMASFVARMLNLPAAGTDYFDDDNGNTHEANINAVALAGITLGCDEAGTKFCPADPVTRAQMASFLARGLKLPAASINYFGDDEGNTHEANINRIALAGITLGCNPAGTNYCPSNLVTRGQMASFLARSLATGVNGLVTVNITAPADLAVIYTAWDGSAYSASVTLTATAVSPTASPTTVIWQSSDDGLLGTGSSIGAVLSIPGASDSSQPTITATAVDENGAIGSATIQLKLLVPSP